MDNPPKEVASSGMEQYFTRLNDRIQKETRGSLLDQIITSFGDEVGLTPEEPAVRVVEKQPEPDFPADSKSVNDTAGQPSIDLAMPAETTIQEAETVFDEELSEMPIGAYAVSSGSYKLFKGELTAAEFLQQEFDKRTMLEQGILMAEILGKPVALKQIES